MTHPATVKFIFKRTELFGCIAVNGTDEIHRIIEQEILSGDPPEGWKPYIIQVQRATGLAGPNGQPIMDAAEISVPADHSEQVFEQLPRILQEWTEQSKKNVAKAMIAAPPPPGFDAKKMINSKNGYQGPPRFSVD